MWPDNETNRDLLGYQVHADLLQKIILEDAMLPITIGVFGNWGSGKSSLMLLLHQGIENWRKNFDKEETDKKEKNPDYAKSSGILQIQFNSWQFEGYDSTKLTMIESILEALKKDIDGRKDCFEKVDDFISRINILKLGVLILKKAYDNLTPDYIKQWLPTEKEIDEITENTEYKSLMTEVRKGNSSRFIEQFREIFESIIEEANYKAVIVYIDDLDRCDPKRIIGCLEAVKLFVNVKKTAFVIGADERIIEVAIEQHCPIKPVRDEISSPFSDYLEKLIHLPYKLPKLSDNEQETYITLLLCQNILKNQFDTIHSNYVKFRAKDKHSKYDIVSIKEASPGVDFTNVEYLLPIVPIMKQFLNGNPRQIKRFLNTLSVRMELAKVAGFDDLRPDVLVKLMVLEYNTKYAARFEDLYRMQRDNDGLLPIKNAEEQAKIETGIQDDLWKENWSSPYLTQWLGFQPSLTGVNLQNYFWVARDALKNEKPIATFVTNKINLVFKSLCSIQVDATMKKRLPEICVNLEDEEKYMLISLINDKLRTQPTSPTMWRILNSDEENILIGKTDIDNLKRLFLYVDTEQIDPQASTFFVRFKKIEGEFADYINKLTISSPLNNSINRKMK